MISALSQAARIKEIERVTNHDVKAVEYFLKESVQEIPELVRASEFIHFACTSEDINNTSHALMLTAAREGVLLPALAPVVRPAADAGTRAGRRADALAHARTARLADHGGQGVREFRRPARSRTGARSRRVEILAKMNGAVGNFNAHLAAYPELDWEAFARGVVESLGLAFNPYTIQIEPHDYMAELLRRGGARQHDPARPRPGRLGLHLAGFLQAEAQGRRDRLVDDAAQGQPDRLRELRGQPRPGQRAAAPPGRQAAGVALAARPDRLDRAAQHRRGAGLLGCSPGTPACAGWASSR